MSDGTHTIPEGSSGKKIDVSALTVGGNAVERQRVVLADDIDPAALARILKTSPDLSAYGSVVRPVFPGAMSGAFGPLIAVPETPVVHLSFPYGVLTTLTTSTTANGGTITGTPPFAIAQTSAANNGSAKLESKGALRYIPGQGAQCKFTALFTAGVANSRQEVGIGDDSDGFFFGYNGASFGIFRRSGGSDTFTAQNAWNVDVMSGAGPSGMVLDPTKGNVYFIQFQWLGFGAIRFYIEDQNTGTFQLVHTIQYANQNTVTSIANPQLPLHMKAVNTGNTSNLTLKVPSISAIVEGPQNVTAHQRAVGNAKSIGGTETCVFVVRNNATLNGATNRSRVRMLRYAFSNDGAQDCTFRLWRNPTIGGAPSYSDIDASNSALSLDTAGTTVTGGTKFFECYAGANNSAGDFLTPDLERIHPGDIIAFTAQRAGGSATTRASLMLREEF